MNNARSSIKYVDKVNTNGKPIYACECYQNCTTCTGKAIMTKDGFVPPDIWKGQIARAVLYMATKYPKYYNRIDKEVLDLGLAMVWNAKFPSDTLESQWRLVRRSNVFFKHKG